MLSADPVLQALDRRLALECGVAVSPVVEHFDVLEQVIYRFVAYRVARAVDPFILETVEEALGWCVSAIALAAHRADHAVPGSGQVDS